MLQFLKATKKEILPESLKPLCPGTVKWQSFQFLQVIFKNLFGRYFATSQIPAICFSQCT